MGLQHRMPGRTLLALAVAAVVAGAAAAQDAARQERIQFAEGATEAVVEGAVSGYDSVEYQVAASIGQVMKIGLEADNPSAYFNVYRPGELPGQSTALHIGPRDGNDWSATLRKSGDYTVQVFLVRAAARRAETASYTLTVSVTGAAAGAAVAPEAVPMPAEDFADGLAGGPDFWKVSGLAAGDELKLRAAPSTTAEVLGRFPAGTLLRNQGCRMTGTQRWCAVEAHDDAALKGWVSGRYLSEATDVPGTGG